MNKKILIIVGVLLTLGMIGIAVISSYGSITLETNQVICNFNYCGRLLTLK